MNTATLVLNIAYVALVSSTFTRRILWLRGALVVAGVFFVIYGLMTSNWTMVFWNSVTSTLHGAQGARYIQSRRSVTMSDGDAQIRDAWFADVEPFDFQTLWTMGETVDYVDGVLAAEGQTQMSMMMILDGIADIDVGGEHVGSLQRGDLIGEVSFLRGSSATATVTPSGRLTVREWNQDRLRTLDHLNPAAAIVLRRRIQDNLADKLLKRPS